MPSEKVDYEIDSEDRTWGILVHASGYVGLVMPIVGNTIVPLIIWLIKKEESEFVDANGKNAVNFQISWSIYLILAGFSVVILIGFVLLPLVALGWFVLTAVASINTSNDQVYTYPLTIRFVT